MAIECPKCGGTLKAFGIRSSFRCPFCSASLKGHFIGPLVVTILLWQLADLFLYPLFHILVGVHGPLFFFEPPSVRV